MFRNIGFDGEFLTLGGDRNACAGEFVHPNRCCAVPARFGCGGESACRTGGFYRAEGRGGDNTMFRGAGCGATEAPCQQAHDRALALARSQIGRTDPVTL
jgi:hypothetical protein